MSRWGRLFTHQNPTGVLSVCLHLSLRNTDEDEDSGYKGGMCAASLGAV